MPDRDEPRRIVHIGPGQDPTDDGYGDDNDGPSFLIQDARERVQREDHEKREANRLAKRLVGAFIAVVILAVCFHIVLPMFKIRIPPVVPLLCYGVILAAAIITARDENAPRS